MPTLAVVGAGPKGIAIAAKARALAAAGLDPPRVVLVDRGTASAAEIVPSLIRPGDVVLVKASRGIGLEAVCRALTEAQ